MINDNDFKILSDEAYAVDNKVAGNSSQKTGEIITNCMQAMAGAPFINGKVDTSQIVIAYAGTSPDEGLDILTDARTVIVGSKLLDTSKLFTPAESLIDGQIICVENGLRG